MVRKLIVGINDLDTNFPNLSKEWDYSLNIGTPKDYTCGSIYLAHWKCSICGMEWTAKIRDRVNSKWQLCPNCTIRERGKERHKRELQRQGSITNPLLLKEWDYEKNKNGPEEYTPKSNEEVFWICSKCGYRFKAKINNRAIRNGGCACCSNKVVVEGVNDLPTTHPELAKEWHPTKNGDLKPTDVSYGMGKKVWWRCPEGHDYQATINHRSCGTNCPKCNSGRQTSFAEQAVYYYVKKVFPDAISRYKDIFTNGMELDIYIPSIRLGIEYDGMAWHKTDTSDREYKKYMICQENGIKLFRLKEKYVVEKEMTGDEYLSIDGNMYEHDTLAKTIRILLDEIDPECNKWTRKRPIFHSKVDINIKQDENEIRSYMTKTKTGSLAELYPNLAKEWHIQKNKYISPEKVKPHSDISVWWLCPTCQNEYRATIGHRTDGTGCPKCGILKSALKRSKQIVMCDIQTGEEIKCFDSISQAARELGINSSNITSVCKGFRKNAGGYIWKYYEK